MTFEDAPPPADLLWRLNQTYIQRLGKARSRMEMLSHLLAERGAQADLLEAVGVAQEECARLYADHRRWRYAYLYQDGDESRMVQDAAEIGRALAQFARLRQKHAQHAGEIAVYLQGRRPDPAWTTIAHGDDLWALTLAALADLQIVEYA